ncbi:UNVERIFIED_CONTAM: hypothetical protein FKN15_032378 [Acipenser sinensis]
MKPQPCSDGPFPPTDITQKTLAIFGLYPSPVGHTELSAGHHKRDREDEEAVLGILTMFNMFSRDASPGMLQNVATKGLATEKIQTSLLNARRLGQEQVMKFVEERLVRNEDGKPAVIYHQKLKKNNALTFSDLYNVKMSKMSRS